jgi:quinohemoprotein ethanol dehydrogenase
LLAWDPVEQQAVWQVENPSFTVNGGVVTTAGGLVFQGTADGKFRAYNAGDGTILWEYDLGAGVIAPPITYMMDGQQFVSIAVGWGGGIPSLWRKATEQRQPGTIFTFTLGSDTSRVYTGFPEVTPPKLIDIDYSATEDEISMGGNFYRTHCQRCHGVVGMNGGSIPNLAYSNEAVFGMMKEIVLEGAFLELGMPNFSDRITEEDVQLIKKYILESARNLRVSTSDKNP